MTPEKGNSEEANMIELEEVGPGGWGGGGGEANSLGSW